MKKTVHFDKYVPYTLTKNKEGIQVENKLKLNKLFELLASKPNSESLREVYGEKYRLQVCKFHKESGIWEIQILHLRNSILPGIADEDSNFELLVLPDGSYPTESSTVLYSPETDLLYIQRNIVCMSAKRMCAYLKELLPETTKIQLKPVIAGERIGRITEKTAFRKVVLACTIDKNKRPDPTRRLDRLLSEYANYRGVVANITIGMGRKKGRLNSVEVSKLVKEAYEETDMQTLRVQLDSTGIGNYEWLDLLLDREFNSFVFEYSKENPITHDRLFSACHEAITN